mmetsp:Transcript_17330/g.54461  ORF Transcript_17330/g.54461 Transcript_17330/m.54461 type:complete len:218 (-) Transcript_17330:45-698(-)
MKFWSTNRLAIFGSTSLDTTKRRKNSYTICRCGHARSRDGSSSSGSENASGSLFRVCKARKMLAPTMLTTSAIRPSLKQVRVLLTYSTISRSVCRFASFSRAFESSWKSKICEQASILRRRSSARSPEGASRSLGRAEQPPLSAGGFAGGALVPEGAALAFASGPLAVARPAAVARLSVSLPMRRFTVWRIFMGALLTVRANKSEHSPSLGTGESAA